ncbi:hypothetical protein JD76_06123 [Micromonospora endolithica]|nr:hypothetical protein JD76_06123 [Micromonospora endolithica]
MRAHRTDLVSLAFGMLFLGFAAWWLLAQILGLVLPPVGWFLAGALLLVGVLGLVGALRSARSPRPAPVAPSDGRPVVGTDEWPTAVVDRDDAADEWPTAVTDRGDRADEWPTAPFGGGSATASGATEDADDRWPDGPVPGRDDDRDRHLG